MRCGLCPCHSPHHAATPTRPACSGFGHYYKQQLKVIDWANAQAALPINKTCGVGVAGHSMGGQSTLYSAAYNSSTHNIKAAAMHHAFTHT